MRKNIFRFATAAAALIFLSFNGVDAGLKAPEGMAVVPAGWFIMGENDGYGPDGPRRKVYLNAYAIDKYEVTNEDFKEYLLYRKSILKEHYDEAVQFQTCLPEGKDKPAPKIWTDSLNYPPEYAKHPVVCVAQPMAEDYCKRIGKHLPTEAQWEKAARGVDGRKYPWGKDWDAGKTNIGLGKAPWINAEDGFAKAAPVGSFPSDVSPYGVYDMAGNVWEWMSDVYSPTYHKIIRAKNPPAVTFEMMPESKKMSIYHFYSVRGGSWALGEKNSRAFYRKSRLYYQQDDSGGFRCAKDL